MCLYQLGRGGGGAVSCAFLGWTIVYSKFGHILDPLVEGMTKSLVYEFRRDEFSNDGDSG